MGRTGWNVALLGAFLITGCIEAKTYKPVIPPPPTVPQPRLPQNNAYTGSIHSPRPGALQPRFTWTAAITEEDDPIVYELELSTSRDFSAEIFSFKTQETSPQLPEALPVSMTPPVGRRYFWRVRACLPLICSDYSAVRWINLGRSDHDYNGDGYADVLVGAPDNDDNGMNAGKAYVYFGGAGSTFDTAPDGVLSNSETRSNFGEAVTSAGDFDGDGFADVLVGSPLGGTAGSAYLYFGRAGATFKNVPDLVLSETPATGRFGAAVSSAGDFNGDGFADLVIGAPGAFENANEGSAYLYFGEAERTKPQGVKIAPDGLPHHFGAHVALLGDIDNDGLADIAVGDEPNLLIDITTDCSSRLYLGRREATTRLVVSDSITQPGGGCKVVLEAAGDVNRDGFSDWLQAFGVAEGSGFSEAMVALRFGSETRSLSAKEVLLKPRARSMNAIGDVNGDGFDDFALNKTDMAITVDVYLGAAQLASPLAPVVMQVGAQGTFGSSLAGMGDVNGDGLADLAIGDHSINSSRGAVTMYFGVENSHPFDASVDGLLDAGVASSAFGFAIASLDFPRCHRTLL